MTSFLEGRRIAIGGLACAAALLTGACCPTTAGPTAPAATFTTSLGPGRIPLHRRRHPIVHDTDQHDLQDRAGRCPDPSASIDPNCLPAAEDRCQTFYESTLTARPAGVPAVRQRASARTACGRESSSGIRPTREQIHDHLGDR